MRLNQNEHAANLASHTRPKAEEQARERLTETQPVGSQSLPVWIRAPKVGYCKWTGLSRGKLYDLHWSGKIRSISLREPGRKNGIRLFNLASILAYIESEATRDTATTEAA